jgi:hypothetical protein
MSPSKPKNIKMCNNLFRTAKETQHFIITTTDWLRLFREVMAGCSENHEKHINTLCGQIAELLIIKSGDTYR